MKTMFNIQWPFSGVSVLEDFAPLTQKAFADHILQGSADLNI